MTSYTVGRGSRATRFSILAIALLVVILGVFPLWADRGWTHLLSEFFGLLTLAMLWNLLAGYTGLVSVGQQAYVGIGGYSLFVLMTSLSLPPLAAIPLSGVIGALAAVPCAFLLFRLKGPYFAIGSWVVAEVIRLTVLLTPQLGGARGISLPAALVRTIAPTPQARESIIYWMALGLAVAALIAIVIVIRSKYGLALTAIRDSEIASESLGVSIRRTKLALYVGVAAATSMAGGVIFLQKLRITPDAAFSLNDFTAFVIFIAVIGGLGSLEGPIVGTILFFLFRETMSELGTVYLMVLGAVAIGIMLAAPRGLWGLLVERFDIELIPIRRRVVPKG